MSLWDSWLRREFAASDWASVWQAVIVIDCRLTPSVASTGEPAVNRVDFATSGPCPVWG